MVEGVNVGLRVDTHNRGIVPVYLPSTSFVVSACENRDAAVPRAKANPAGWLGKGESKTATLTAFIPIEDVPELALGPLVNGGDFKFCVEARLALFGLGVNRRMVARGSISETIRRRLGR